MRARGPLGPTVRRRGRTARCLLTLALVSCGAAERRPAPEARELGRERYFHVAAVGDAVVTGRTSPTSTDPGNVFAVRTWELVDPATGERDWIPLPESPECERVEYVRAFAIDATTVGFHRSCHHGDEVVSYDLRSARLRVLFTVGDERGGQYLRIGNGEYLAVHDSELCSRFVRYRHGRVVPLGIALEKDGWPLDADRAPGEEDCRSYGLVTTPAVSATGEIAFLASTDARGRSGHRRPRSTYALYVVGADGVARAIARSPGHPRALTWNAGGSALYLSVDGGDGNGVYEVTRDGTVTLVTATVAGGLAVVGDGLVVVEDDTDGSLIRRLALLRVP